MLFLSFGFVCPLALCSLFSDAFPLSFSAADNIPKADEIRTLVKDTWDTRIAKLRLSADSFVKQQEAHARVREICDNLRYALM